MKKIDEIVVITLSLVSAFIFINHLVFGLFEETAFKFSIMLPLWIFLYGLITDIIRN